MLGTSHLSTASHALLLAALCLTVGCNRWSRRAVAAASEHGGCPRGDLTAAPERDGRFTVSGCGAVLAVQCGAAATGPHRCDVVQATAGGTAPSPDASPLAVAPPAVATTPPSVAIGAPAPASWGPQLAQDVFVRAGPALTACVPGTEPVVLDIGYALDGRAHLVGTVGPLDGAQSYCVERALVMAAIPQGLSRAVTVRMRVR